MTNSLVADRSLGSVDESGPRCAFGITTISGGRGVVARVADGHRFAVGHSVTLRVVASNRVFGQRRRLVVVDHGRLVERVVAAQHPSGLLTVELANPLADQQGGDRVA